MDQRQRRLTLALTLTFGRSKFPLDFLSLRENRSGYFYLTEFVGSNQRFNLSLCEAWSGYIYLFVLARGDVHP